MLQASVEVAAHRTAKTLTMFAFDECKLRLGSEEEMREAEEREASERKPAAKDMFEKFNAGKRI